MPIKGFTKPKIKPRTTFSMIIYGPTKVGKTRFALTAPGPIAFINFDRALQDVLPQVPKVDVLLADLSDQVGMIAGGSLEATSRAAIAVEQKFCELYEAASASDAKTIVVDKTTTLWEIMRMASFGKLEQVKPHHYVKVNSRMRQYMLSHQKVQKNVIFIEDTKEEWINEKPTGRWIRDGFKHAGTLVHVEAEMSRLQPDEEDAGFRMEIKSCGLNAELVGWEFENDEINFDGVAGMVLA